MGEEKEKPLTREDVLRLIEENSGTAKGLDLSGKTFESGIDLSGLDLHGIILKGADLRATILLNANFQGADLMYAKFGDRAEGLAAMLDNSDLRDAGLCFANFEGCYFTGTKLEGALIQHAKIFNAHLEEADWGSYFIGEEKGRDFYSATHYYRRLKTWYTNAGRYDIAAKFYYREKEARRKSIQNIMHMLLKQRKCRKLLKLLLKQEGGWTLLWLWIYRLLCGYGEKTLRIIGWAAFVIFGSALIYFLIGSTWEWGAFWSSLYFSAVSFTALGYGSWVQVTNSWVKGIGAFESLVGVSMLALLLVTFFRKWTR